MSFDDFILIGTITAFAVGIFSFFSIPLVIAGEAVIKKVRGKRPKEDPELNRLVHEVVEEARIRNKLREQIDPHIIMLRIL